MGGTRTLGSQKKDLALRTRVPRIKQNSAVWDSQRREWRYLEESGHLPRTIQTPTPTRSLGYSRRARAGAIGDRRNVVELSLNLFWRLEHT